MVIDQQAERLLVTSLPNSSRSRINLELTVEPPVATGTWREATAPDGPYVGTTFHGALQLVIEPDRRIMHGMWLGFGRRLTMNTGEWTLTWQDESTSPETRQEYSGR
ncbi:hypothetical protein [Promicromonospora sp. NPDC059942]|uniref:hypothetical protein n=1 Tax=Promicromonospora sp. NPDC059942 TaxID=3347009 RepID=UPI00364DBA0A